MHFKLNSVHSSLISQYKIGGSYPIEMTEIAVIKLENRLHGPPVLPCEIEHKINE